MKQKLMLAFIICMALLLIKPNEGRAADIMNPKQTYTYEEMVRDIKAMANRYPDIIKYKTIGTSEYGRQIYAVSLGTGNAKTFINGSHHAREWISTNLNMYMLEQYAKMYKANQSFGGYNVKKVLDETTIWFVPMVNPDGVTLQQSGLSKFPKSIHSSLINMNEGSTNFKRWKANAKGIDLNRQYNADWKNIRNNYTSPRWSNHKGAAPEQASETKAIVKFTKEINPEMSVAYHSSGEILYWYFHQSGSIFKRDEAYAKKIGQYTGYSLVKPISNPSGGGYTDWFVQKYGRPGFTPELGTYAGNTHVPLSQFDKIWSQNKYIGLYTASEGYKLYLTRGGKPKPKEVNVKIDGKLIAFDQPALYIDGRTMVPVRGVFEKLGASVNWSQATNTITARKGTTIVELKIGSKTAKVNGISKTLDVAPLVLNNRTLIPLRFISEALGAKVGWDQAAFTALITSPPADSTPPEVPAVNPVSDVTLTVTGKSELNSTVVVKKEKAILGEAKTNDAGQFKIKIPAQPANTILNVTSTDMAGNVSKPAQIKVTYTSMFIDTVGHWAEKPIGYLKDRKITNGYPDGTFGVAKNISRAEAAAFLVRSMGLNTENLPDPKFPDVNQNHQFYKQIAAVYHNGIMQGTPDGRFNPEKTLTRAEMAMLLVNAFDLASRGNESFPDVKQSHWAYEAISILASNGFAGGYPDGTYRPDLPIQRAEFAALLARVLQAPPAEEEVATTKVKDEKEGKSVLPEAENGASEEIEAEDTDSSAEDPAQKELQDAAEETEPSITAPESEMTNSQEQEESNNSEGQPSPETDDNMKEEELKTGQDSPE